MVSKKTQGFVVTLAAATGAEEAKEIALAIQRLKGVVSAVSIPDQYSQDFLIAERMHFEYTRYLLAFFEVAPMPVPVSQPCRRRESAMPPP